MKPGDVVGERFDVDALAGQGGMGQVFRAVDRTSGAFVAVKVLSADKHAARFEREASILEKLSHQNIVRHVERGATAAGQPFLVMEWLEGEDLSKRLARSRLTLEETLAIIAGAASALAAAHDEQIVHRDVKPSNIFLVGKQPNQIKMLDFGIARSNTDKTLTATGSFLGTPAYTAPERARDGLALDARADVYSLGCVFYECLTGQPAFEGSHLLSVLTKVLTTQPPRIRDVRPELPAAVDDLVVRMMAKDPDDRPHDGTAVLEAIRLLLEETSLGSNTVNVVTNAERRSSSVLIVRGATISSHSHTHTLDGANAETADGLRQAISKWGGRFEMLANDVAVVSVKSAHAATDNAAQAARCAMWLREHTQLEAIALATWNVGPADMLIPDDALLRATELLRLPATPPSDSCPIVVDETTARLLDARFDIRNTGGIPTLQGEVEGAIGTRRLLGQTTPCVGRDRELSTLAHLYADSVDERSARAALLLGSAGMGKSRIVQEFLLRLGRKDDATTSIWLARGDALRAESTLGLLAQVIRGACEIRSGEPFEAARSKLATRVARHVGAKDRQRVTEFLSEVIGTPTPEDSSILLRSARRHPQTMTDEMRRAWIDFLRAEALAQPVLLVLEDLHWGDEATIRFIDAALEELAELPWMVMATARPNLRERFAKLWSSQYVHEITLQPLGKKACERLAAHLLADRMDAQAIERLVARADGNAFYLEELIRHAIERQTEDLPATLMAMVQSRLALLDEQDRRLLRAAAIFGESFCPSAISALLGASERAPVLARKLDRLVEHEVLVRRTARQSSSEPEYAFRHMLLREGAYATLVDQDRVVGHKLAGEWLEVQGEVDSGLLAMHFERANEGERAAGHYVRAAETALDGGDYAMAMALAERGAALTNQDDTLAAARAIESVAGLWIGQLPRAASAAKEALRVARSGSKYEGFALHAGLWSAIYMRQTHALEEPMARLMQMQPAPEALAAIAPAFYSLVGTFIWTAQRAQAELCMRRFEEITAEAKDNDPIVAAHLEASRGFIALHVLRDYWRYFVHSERVIEVYSRTGVRRELFLARVNVATGAWTLGLLDRAEEEFARVIATGAPLDVLFARYNRARMLFDQGRVEEAEPLVEECSKQFDAMGEMMIRVDSRTCWMEIQLSKGNIEAADAEAARIGSVESAPYVGQYYHTVLAQIRLAQGRASEASEIAERTYAQSVACGMGYCVGHTKLLNVRAEAFYACGDLTAAREAIRIAQADLMQRANGIPDPAVRKSFLEGLGDHRRTLELAREWL